MSYCNGSTKPHPPLRQSVTDYMQLAGLAERTQQSYLRELGRFANHFDCPPARLSAEDLQGYVLTLIDNDLKPNSTNVTVAALRLLYRDVLKKPEKVESLAMRKVADQLPNTVDEGQILCLIQSTHNLRYRIAIETAYSCGLRMSEVLALKVSDIDRAKTMIHVRCGKGGHERMVFMPPATLEALDNYYRQIHPKPSEWLFYGTAVDKPMTAAALRQAFNQARKLAGIREGFTFHGLRHSFATHLLERGASRDEVQDMLGHKSPQSTRVYARITAAMFEKLDHPAQHLAR